MFDPTTYTGFHTWLSLIALATGIVVTWELIQARHAPGWTAVFLATAVATSVTGFGFPFTGILPSHVLGAIALVVLGFGIVARYRFVLRGVWRWIYALTTVTSVYLLAFVAIAQTFQKVPALQAPNLSAVLFTAAQVSALAVFAALAVVAVRTFRPPLAGRALG